MPNKTLLKVSNSTIPAKMGGSIFHIYMSDPAIEIRAEAVGSNAFYNMLKGIVKSQGYFEKVNLRLLTEWQISYQKVPGTDQDVTVFTVDFSIQER